MRCHRHRHLRQQTRPFQGNRSAVREGTWQENSAGSKTRRRFVCRTPLFRLYMIHKKFHRSVRMVDHSDCCKHSGNSSVVYPKTGQGRDQNHNRPWYSTFPSLRISLVTCNSRRKGDNLLIRSRFRLQNRVLRWYPLHSHHSNCRRTQ